MKKEKGFIGIIILIIITLALFKYFLNWSIFEAIKTPRGQETVGYTHNIISSVWGYIRTPLIFIWSKILGPVLSLIWQAFQALIALGRK